MKLNNNNYKMFPIEIYQLIIKYLSLRDKLKFFELNKILYNNLKIYKLYDKIITQCIIEQKKFSELIKLYVFRNKKIKSVNHLHKLEVLDCRYNCASHPRRNNKFSKFKNIICR